MKTKQALRFLFVASLLLFEIPMNALAQRFGVGLGDGYSSSSVLIPPPRIDSFEPHFGQTGTFVTLTGDHFIGTSGGTNVFWGAVRAQEVVVLSTTLLSARVPSGATHSPISVTTNGLTGYSRTPFVVTFPTTGSIDPSSFATDTPLPTGSGTKPYAVFLSDLNGDGRPDLVLSDNVNNTGLQVYENTGTGNVIAFGTKVTLGLGTTTRSAAVSDLDSDGKPDIVVTNIFANAVTVYRNRSNGGVITGSSFEDGVVFPGGVTPREIAIHDYNEDGKPDIAVSNLGSGRVTILRNTHPGGIFTTTSFDTVGFSAGASAFGIAAGFIDDDARPDLVVGNTTTGTSLVRVFKNSSVNGNITFGSSPTILNAIGSPHSVSLADINGDGLQDVVVPGVNDSTVSVFKNMSGPSIQFDLPVFLHAGINPRFAAIGDLDGDGRPDVVIANSGWNILDQDTVSVFHNESSSGGISFSSKVDFVVGRNPRSLAIGDLNGDARPEILSADFEGSSVTMLKNGIRQPPRILSVPASGSINSAITITGTGFDPVPASNVVTFGAVRAAVTGGTISSLSVIVPPGANHAPVTVTSSGLTAFSNNPFVVTFPSSGIIDASSLAPRVDFATGDAPLGLTLGDLDGDGKPDLAVANDSGSSVSFLRNLVAGGTISTSSFAPRLDSLIGGLPNEVIETDLDGDGKLDVAVVSASANVVSLFRNTGTSGVLSFAPRANIPVGSQPRNLASTDLDSDGKPDLVVTDFNNSSISLLRNISTPGVFQFAPRIVVPAPFHTRGISCADLNEDDMPDIVLSCEDIDSIVVYQNASSFGTLALRPRVTYASGNRPLGVQVADIDLDGAPDILIVNFDGDSISILRNMDVAGDISQSSFVQRVSFPAGNQPRNLATGDVDGDGRPDVVTANRGSNTLSVFKNASTPGVIDGASLLPKVDFATGGEPRDVTVGDLNADGKPEVIASNTLNDSFSVFENTVSTTTTAQFRISRDSVPLGAVQVGHVHDDTVTVSNGGGAALNITSASSTDSNFTVSPQVTSIPVGGNAIFTITFRPTRTGVDTGQIVFLNNSPSSLSSISVNGNGTDAILSHSGPLSFGEVPVNAQRVDSVTVTNTGQINLEISGIQVTDTVFAVTADPTPIPPNVSRKFRVTFNPREAGPRSAQAVFTHNGSGSQAEVTFSGTGIAAVFSPDQESISFGNVAIGDSLVDSVRITNNGGLQLTVDAVPLAPPFSPTTPAFVLLPGAFKIIPVTFKPESPGGVQAPMVFIHNGVSSPDTLTLDGNGVQAGFFALADTVSFGTVVVQDSLVRDVSVRNSGIASLVISSVTSTNAAVFAVPSAGTTILPGDTATFAVTFRPASADTVTAGIVFDHSSPSSPTTVTVSGIGASPGFYSTVGSLPFGNVTVDSTAETFLTIENTSSADLSIDSVVSDNPRFHIEPRDTIIPAHQQSDFRVTFTPTDETAQAGQLIFSHNPGAMQSVVTVGGVGRFPQFFPLQTSVPFGGVTVGTDTQTTVRIFNNGLVPLAIDSVITSLPGEFSVSPTFLRIDPGAEGLFTTSFAPVQGGGRIAQLVFVHNGRYNGSPAPSSLPMTGTGLVPIFESVSSVPFADTGVGLRSRKNININNSGNGRLLVYSIDVDEPFSREDSTLDLAPGEDRNIRVFFSPASAADFIRTIRFSTNIGQRQIVLTGRGVNAPASPTLTSPGTGNTNVSVPVTFTWLVSPGAGLYRLQIALDQNFTILVLNDSTIASTARQVDGLALNTSYYWRVSAMGVGGEGPFSAMSVFTTSPSRAYSQVTVSDFPTVGHQPTDYRLVGFPGTEDHVVSTIFTGVPAVDWKVFRDNGNTTGPILTPLGSTESMKNGEGYWGLRKGPLIFSDSDVPMPALQISGNDSIPLRNGAGWNIIATRFDRAVAWTDVMAKNLARGLSANAVIYSYTGTASGNGFTQAAFLEPFKGYYLFDSTVTSLIIPYPFPGRTQPPDMETPFDWKLQIAFYSDRTLDAENYIGIAPASQGERDGLDAPKPPALSGQSQLYFSRPAWGTRSDRFASDIRPVLGDGQVWDFMVHNTQTLPARIAVRGIPDLPEDLQVVLLDLFNTTPVDLRMNSEYIYPTASDHMNFRLLVGSFAFVEREHEKLIPAEFSLDQNFPNPFNPSTSLKINLPRDARIKLEIFSSIGQHIATPAEGDYGAGTHTVIWDARNDRGSQVASGVYLYRLVVDGKRLKVRKMMLLR